MNFSKRKSDLSVLATAFSVILLAIGTLPGLTNSIARAAGKGLDVEVPFEIKALKTPGLVAPYFIQDDHGAMVVSDQAGGVTQCLLYLAGPLLNLRVEVEHAL